MISVVKFLFNHPDIHFHLRADRMVSDDKDIYYFNGDNSYLAFQTLRGSNPSLRTTSVNIKTASEDGLIMFYGEGSEQVRQILILDLSLF